MKIIKFVERILTCLDIRQLLGMEIWFCHLFTGIHEAETKKKKYRIKRIFDKKRLMKLLFFIS